MAYLAPHPDDRTVEIPMDETLTELKRALPKDHPVIARVELAFERARGVLDDWDQSEETLKAEKRNRPDFEGIVDELAPLLSDWRRGIRDWEEVEPAFRRAAKASDWIGA